jgi:hypothetical protein
VGRYLLGRERDDVTEDIEGMDALNKRMAALGEHKQMLGKLGLLAVSYAKETVPRKTGNLGRTIRLGQVTDTEVQILAGGQGGVGYAQVVEFGSKAHIIRPKNRKALRWGANARLSGTPKSGSAVIFATYVNHPGTQPKPYLIPAAQKAVSEAGIDLVVQAWNDAA